MCVLEFRGRKKKERRGRGRDRRGVVVRRGFSGAGRKRRKRPVLVEKKLDGLEQYFGTAAL